MRRIYLLASLGFAFATAAPASAACAGADPAIVSAVVKNVSQANGTSRYTLAVTVTNVGDAAQAGDTLQFVNIHQIPGEKLDAKGIPPLRPGQSYGFTYDVLRASDAGNGTTTMLFQLDVHRPMPPAAADCSATNDSARVTF